MNYNDLITQKNLNMQKIFFSFSSEELSVFKFNFSSVPNKNGDVIKNIIVSQHIHTDYNYTNSSFFVSSNNKEELFYWFLTLLSNNKNIVDKIYFEDLGDGFCRHTILDEHLKNNGVKENIFIKRQLKFSKNEVLDFFENLRMALTNCSETLNKQIDEKMLDFLRDELNTSPLHVIINANEQKMLSLGHFNTQYFKYLYNNITLSQFLNDNTIREVILNARLYSHDNHSSINIRKKL